MSTKNKMLFLWSMQFLIVWKCVCNGRFYFCVPHMYYVMGNQLGEPPRQPNLKNNLPLSALYNSINMGQVIKSCVNLRMCEYVIFFVICIFVYPVYGLICQMYVMYGMYKYNVFLVYCKPIGSGGLLRLIWTIC